MAIEHDKITLPKLPQDEPPPALAGYRTFLLGLAPFVLALTALVVLAIARPDLLDIQAILQIMGLGSTGAVGATFARSYDKKTALERDNG